MDDQTLTRLHDAHGVLLSRARNAQREPGLTTERWTQGYIFAYNTAAAALEIIFPELTTTEETTTNE